VTNKLLIVTDLGVFKAYKVELTPRHTPRLVPLENIVLEDARFWRFGLGLYSPAHDARGAPASQALK